MDPGHTSLFKAIQQQNPSIFHRFFNASVDSQFESPARTELQSLFDRYASPAQDFDRFILSVRDSLSTPSPEEEDIRSVTSTSTQTDVSYGGRSLPPVPKPPDLPTEPFHVVRFLSRETPTPLDFPLGVVFDRRPSEDPQTAMRPLLEAIEFLSRRYEYPLLCVLSS